MRLSSACRAVTQVLSGGLGAAVLLGASLPALAGDMHNGAAGGLKGYGSGGVPVPAPMPYNETYKWYLRGDIGTGFKHAGTIGVEGLPASVLQPKDWHELSILSFGFGRYITPSLRTEFTLDYRTPRNLASGTKTLADITRTGRLADTSNAGGPIINVQTNVYSGFQNENTDYQNTTLLMSAFYDFNRTVHPRTETPGFG